MQRGGSGGAASDWSQGLPLDVLALVAGGREELKGMRGVNKLWQQGFDVSVSTLRFCTQAPPLPAGCTFCERFPGLTSLDLGESPMAEAGLAQKLGGLRQLRTLVLGGSWRGGRDQENLLYHLAGSCFGGLGGLPLQSLSLRGCPRLGDAALEGLRGLPLTGLDLGACHELTGVGLQHLRDMPMTALDLGWCRNLVNLGGLQNLPLASLVLRACGSFRDLGGLGALPLTRLDLSNCWELRDEDLAPLQGLPLTGLNLGGCSYLFGSCLAYLSGMPLSRLSLCGCVRINDVQFLVSMEVLPLTSLDVGDTWLAGMGFLALRGMPIREMCARGCSHLWGVCLSIFVGSSLTKLDLAGCVQIDDMSLFMISTMPCLEFLDLSACIAISDMGLRLFHALPLKSLILDQCTRVTDVGVESFRGLPLESLSLAECPLLTDACLGVLLSLPMLKLVSLENCHRVSFGGTDQFESRGVHCER